ncbi:MULTISPECIES: SusC/RagA family TonB-linked outer membrane protein [Niastella]|uniref:TonB-dependent receptor n=1 Tax=Niastella soli TaxID=2821487 RepID=A0ABS3Z274_9BACT|nr:TonB-dependent receptor [Niastella soli]MBO9204255.1 TonB-dependent receptor [Niastella soli]
MNRLYPKGFNLLLFLLVSHMLVAQTTISGTVLSDEQTPLEGVTIQVKGQAIQTLTNSKGGFTVTVPVLPVLLLISHTGYQKGEFNITTITPSSFRLIRNERNLDEVVVTGYSTQNKKLIAGSIQTINSQAFRDVPASGFNQLLQGKATGVQVNANSGVPGGGITFRIRGNNSINASVDPLYIIDGVFISNTDPIQTGMGQQQGSNPIADINPSDIENITILKDANATAIYGSLGANGVVIVTTKRGRLNSRAKVSLNGYHGWSTATKKFKVASGPETALLTNESRINTVKDNPALPPPSLIAEPDSQPTFDRISDLFRTAHTSNYEVAVQGGTDKSAYYAGFGYIKQEGIVRPSNFERYSGRLNYDNYLNQKVKIGTSVNISRTWRNVSSNDNNPQGVINSAIFVRSYLPVFNSDGTYARYGSFDNHLALINYLGNNAVGWRTIGNVYGEYAILPQLKLRTSWSLDNASEYENNFTSSLLAAGVASNGSAASYETKNLVLTNEQVLTFIQSFGEDGKHSINALVGNTINTVLSQSTSATGTGFASNDLTAVSVASVRSGSSAESRSKLLSVFAKASYTYNNRYTLDASFRADGSSKFGENHRWGYFPSGGFTWRADQEDFIQSLNLFNELRFRTSIGLSGNQNGIGPYAAQGLWQSGSNYLDQPGIAPSQLANPDLTWETTRQSDLGTEFSILNSRLFVSVDYYNKYTYDLLLNVPVPNRTGFATYLQNYGAVSNKGFELAIRSTNINTRTFKWTTEFNISQNTNRIEKLASDITLGASGRNISILRQGYAVNSFQLYKQLYVDPQTGNAVYEDLTKEGNITAADRQIVGNALPRYTGGFTNSFSYKGFDLNIFFYFQQGNKIMNMNDFFLVHGNTQANIGFVPRQLERWQKPGDITDIPRVTTSNRNIEANNSAANNYGGNVANLSSRYLENGSFIRLRTLSLSYTLPSSIINKLKFNNIRAYIQGTNLITITKYGGPDPEVSSQSGNQNTAGYDWATVPQPKTIQIGLNLVF